MQVLNIPVSPAQLALWRSFLAPARHRFFLTTNEAQQLNFPSEPRASVKLTPEERDTYAVWGISDTADRVSSLSAAEWAALPTMLRRKLLQLQVRHGRENVPLGQHYLDLLPDPRPGRFLWTPELLTSEVLTRLVTRDQRPCQRKRLSASVWQAAKDLLPRVCELAGTFPTGSAGNCFGAVMGAAGLPGAENQWIQREPFEAFLKDRTLLGGTDDRPGTLLVWRSERGVEHVAVTLGGGWAFHKPSQAWMTPRTVLPVTELKRYCRTPGRRLERRRLRRSLPSST